MRAARIAIGCLTLGVGAVAALAWWLQPGPVYPTVKYEQPPKGAKRVLWIGNSHTFRHSIPYRTQQLIEDAGGEPVYIEAIWEAQTLEEQLKSTAVVEALKQPWDLIVAQEQSTKSVTGLFWSRQRLQSLHSTTNAPVYFYQVWSHSYTGLLDATRTRDQVQRHLDNWACNIDDKDGLQSIMAGHLINAERSSWRAAVGLDGNHLSEGGAQKVAQQIAHHLSGGEVEPFGPTSAQLCEGAPHLRGPWLWGRHVRGFTTSVRVQDLPSPVIFHAGDGLILVDPTLDAEFQNHVAWLDVPVVARLYSVAPMDAPEGAPRYGLVDLDGVPRLPPTGSFGDLTYTLHSLGALPAVEFPGGAWWLPDHSTVPENQRLAWYRDIGQQERLRWDVYGGYNLKKRVDEWVEKLSP